MRAAAPGRRAAARRGAPRDATKRSRGAPRFGKRFSAGTKFSRKALRVLCSRNVTTAGDGRAFTLLVLLVLMVTIGATSTSDMDPALHTTLCVGSVSESKFEGRRLGRLSFEPAR